MPEGTASTDAANRVHKDQAPPRGGRGKIVHVGGWTDGAGGHRGQRNGARLRRTVPVYILRAGRTAPTTPTAGASRPAERPGCPRPRPQSSPPHCPPGPAQPATPVRAPYRPPSPPGPAAPGRPSRSPAASCAGVRRACSPASSRPCPKRPRRGGVWLPALTPEGRERRATPQRDVF